MIVCVCRRISDRAIRDAIADSARSAGAVFRAQGCAPKCGACVPFVQAMIVQAQLAEAASEGPALAVGAD